jgi:hypothetical protein
MTNLQSPAGDESHGSTIQTLALRPRDTRHVQAWSQKVGSMEEIFHGAVVDADTNAAIEQMSCRPSRTPTPRCPETLKIIAHHPISRSYTASPTSSIVSVSAYMPDSATTASLASMPLSPTFSASTLSRSTSPDFSCSSDVPDRMSMHHVCRGSHSPRPLSHRYNDSVDSELTFVDVNEYLVSAPFKTEGFSSYDLRDGSDDIAMPENEAPNPNVAAIETVVAPTPTLTYEDTPSCSHNLEPTPATRISVMNGQKEDEAIETDCEDISEDDSDSILDYVLQIAFGADLDELTQPPTSSRRLVAKFVKDIGSLLANDAAQAGTGGGAELTHTVSNASNSSQASSSRSDQGRQRGTRRKRDAGRGDEGDDDELSDGEGHDGHCLKRQRPNPPGGEENLRLSCPFRKRNPGRFNVRDHYSCSMTYFPKFAELRYVPRSNSRTPNPLAAC